MFLGELLENEKRVFWELANCLVVADGSIADSEIEMLEAYKGELDRRDYVIEEPTQSVNEIISQGNIDLRKKKIIYFELLGLAFADKEYVDAEKVLLGEIKEILGISDKDESEMLDTIEKIMGLYLRLGKMLDE